VGLSRLIKTAEADVAIMRARIVVSFHHRNEARGPITKKREISAPLRLLIVA